MKAIKDKIKNKIQVFISSSCDKRFNTIREKIKKNLEETGLFIVYVFEESGSSSLAAKNEYLFKLSTSDVCVFLIDNFQGIPEGVQREIDLAEKINMKSLYYFCDEKSIEPTSIQKKFDPTKSKYSIVHSFDDFFNGAIDLVNEVLTIYRLYCNDFIKTDSNDQTINLSPLNNYNENLIQKELLKSLDKCISFFEEMFGLKKDKISATNNFDELCYNFLPILFKGESLVKFNTNLLLEEIKKYQEDNYFELTKLRWKAIQKYFDNKLEEALELLTDAFNLAEQKKVSEWVVKDILIDKRNIELTIMSNSNIYTESNAQNELNASKHLVHYPIMDRLNSNLSEKYYYDLIKEETQSPFSITLGYNITQINEIVKMYVLAMYNGSITNLLLIHNKVFDLAFYLCRKFSNWSFKKVLFVESMYTYDKSQNIISTIPDFFNKLDAKEAADIYFSYKNQPIIFKQLILQCKTMKYIGLYLNDADFNTAFNDLIAKIKGCNIGKNNYIEIVDKFLECLNSIQYRVPTNRLINILIEFLSLNIYRLNMKIYNTLQEINIKIIAENDKMKLINALKEQMNNTENVNSNAFVNLVSILYNQDPDNMKDLDLSVRNKFCESKLSDYKLNTSHGNDLVEFIKIYIRKIRSNNDIQRKNGLFFDSGNNDFNTILNIVRIGKIELNNELIDDMCALILDTVILESISIEIKYSAINLLIYLCVKYNAIIQNHSKEITDLINKENVYNSFDELNSTISSVNLQFQLNFLCCLFKKGSSYLLLKNIYLIDQNPANKIYLMQTIEIILNADNKLIKQNVISILMQLILTWIHSKYLTLRRICLKNLFLISKKTNINTILKQELIRLVDIEDPMIKESILRFIKDNEMNDDISCLIKEKCKIDNNYYVRKIYFELFES